MQLWYKITICWSYIKWMYVTFKWIIYMIRSTSVMYLKYQFNILCEIDCLWPHHPSSVKKIQIINILEVTLFRRYVYIYRERDISNFFWLRVNVYMDVRISMHMKDQKEKNYNKCYCLWFFLLISKRIA